MFTVNRLIFTNQSLTSGGGGVLPSPTFEIDFTTNRYIGTRFTRASRGTFVNSLGYIQAAEMNLVLQSNDASTATWNKQGTTVTTNQTTAPDGTNTAQFVNEGGGGLSVHRVYQLLAIPAASRGVLTGSVYLKQGLNRTHGFMSLLTRTSGGGFCTYTIVVDLTNGTVTSTNDANSNTVNPSYSVTSVGSGWYRLQVTATTQLISGNDGMAFGVSNSATPTYLSGYPEYTGTNNNGVYAWGAQIVQGSSALLYVATGASSVGTPRVTYDPVTLTNRGLLLERDSTNLITYSEDFANASWTLNTATISTNGGAFWTSPANTATARGLTQTAGNANHAVRQQFANVTQAMWSVFAKKSTTSGVGRYVSLNVRSVSDYVYAVFDLDSGTITQSANVGTVWSNPVYQIENYGNGWYRLFVGASRSSGTTDFLIALADTGTPTMGPTGQVYNAANSTDGVYIWGAQYEALLAQSSYISTAGASATRNADVFGLVATDLSPFWNQTAGSLIIDNRWVARISQNAACRVGAAGASSSMMTELASFGNSQQCFIKNISSAYSGPNAALVINTDYKVGFAYDNGPNFKGFRNGTAGTNVTSVTIPTVDKMEFGTNQNNNMVATNTAGTGSNYTISRLRYWNTKLSDADMQTETT